MSPASAERCAALQPTTVAEELSSARRDVVSAFRLGATQPTHSFGALMPTRLTHVSRIEAVGVRTAASPNASTASPCRSGRGVCDRRFALEFRLLGAASSTVFLSVLYSPPPTCRAPAHVLLLLVTRCRRLGVEGDATDRPLVLIVPGLFVCGCWRFRSS